MAHSKYISRKGNDNNGKISSREVLKSYYGCEGKPETHSFHCWPLVTWGRCPSRFQAAIWPVEPVLGYLWEYSGALPNIDELLSVLEISWWATKLAMKNERSAVALTYSKTWLIPYLRISTKGNFLGRGVGTLLWFEGSFKTLTLDQDHLDVLAISVRCLQLLGTGSFL